MSTFEEAIELTDFSEAAYASEGHAHDQPLWLGETEEWWNTLTHGMGCAVSFVAVLIYLLGYRGTDPGLTVGFVAYGISLVAVFLCSTLSHAVREPQRRNLMRAWDQGAIYLLISGTYTPFAVRYLDGMLLYFVVAAIWIAAAFGFYSKVIARHRVNRMATLTYLLLGWLPAIPFINRVPLECVAWMAAGGVLYSAGVIFLMLDRRVRFFHAVWHLFVISAGAVHFAAVVQFTQSL